MKNLMGKSINFAQRILSLFSIVVHRKVLNPEFLDLSITCSITVLLPNDSKHFLGSLDELVRAVIKTLISLFFILFWPVQGH